MYAELEIIKDGARSAEIIEVGAAPTLTELCAVAADLCRRYGWDRVRVGVGSLWSGWIDNNKN